MAADEMPMVERVARAIYETDPVGVRPWEDAPLSNREDCLVCACAAMAAMREPTEAMVRAAGGHGLTHPDQAVAIWSAMIDEAIK